MPPFAVKRTCRECPWKRSNPPGKFPPERYIALADTADPAGSFPQPIFACHMSKEGGERACAGFLLVVGFDNIGVRLAARGGRVALAEISADGELYSSFAEMAEANGVKQFRRKPNERAKPQR